MGIVIAAVITTLVVVLFYGFFARLLSRAEDRPALIVTALVALPLQPLAFYLVRLPMDGLVSFWLGRGTSYATATTFYAPLTEEPAKWLVLLVPLVWRALTPRTAPALSLATGLGFGVGEIWFLAHQIWQVQAYADIPFWMFQGFLIERFLVCFLHGAFVALFFQALAESRIPVPAAIAGMALHYAVNFPIFLGALGVFAVPAENWQMMTLLVLILIAILLAFMVARLAQRGGALPPRRAEG